MQLVITVPDGATPSNIAHALRFQANLFDGMPPKEASKVENTYYREEEVVDKSPDSNVVTRKFDADDGDEEMAPKKKAAKKAVASFDDDEEELLAPAAKPHPTKIKIAKSFDDDDEETTPVAKPSKAKKPKAPTMVDLNAICKEAARVAGIDTVRALLKKKFKVVSVKDLDEETYGGVIEAMQKLIDEGSWK